MNLATRIPIADYEIILEVTKNKIIAIEESTGSVLTTRTLTAKERIAAIKETRSNGFSWETPKGEKYNAVVNLFEHKATIPTNAGYIFSLEYDSNLRVGTYFGLREWGFFLEEKDQLKILQNLLVDHLVSGTLGVVGGNLCAFLGFSTGEIEAFSLGRSSNIPQERSQVTRLWIIQTCEGLNAVVLAAGHLISALKNGNIHFRDAQSGELRREVVVSSNEVRCLSVNNGICVAGTNDGEAIAVKIPSGDVVWRVKIANERIQTCGIVDERAYFVSMDGSVCDLSLTTGKGQETIKLYEKAASKPVQFKKWVIFGGAENILTWSGSHVEPSFRWEDNLIRAVCVLPLGIIAGNDSGLLSLWSYPEISVGEEK